MLCDLVDGGDKNTRGLLCNAKPLAQATNSVYKGRFLQIKHSNKTSIACEFEVDQLELWQRELSITGCGGVISHLTILEFSR